MNEGAVGCLVVTCIFAMIGAFAIGISAFVKVNQLEVELQELQRAGSNVGGSGSPVITPGPPMINISEFTRFQNFPFPYNGYVYHLTAASLTWEETRDECQSFGGDLAYAGIRNYRTRVSLASALQTDQVWIGLYDPFANGTWLWADGSAATSDDIRWGPNQPDNFQSNEFCGELWPVNFFYQANDDNCHIEHFGLCELPFQDREA